MSQKEKSKLKVNESPSDDPRANLHDSNEMVSTTVIDSTECKVGVMVEILNEKGESTIPFFKTDYEEFINVIKEARSHPDPAALQQSCLLCILETYGKQKDFDRSFAATVMFFLACQKETADKIIDAPSDSFGVTLFVNLVKTEYHIAIMEYPMWKILLQKSEVPPHSFI